MTEYCQEAVDVGLFFSDKINAPTECDPTCTTDHRNRCGKGKALNVS